jgi:hypothetical protein
VKRPLSDSCGLLSLLTCSCITSHLQNEKLLVSYTQCFSTKCVMAVCGGCVCARVCVRAYV